MARERRWDCGGNERGPGRRAAAAAWIVTVVAAWGGGAPTLGADPDPLARFLDRLGLEELEILHLETRLAGQAEQEALETAKRLADLYAGQLMETSGDPQVSQSLLARIQRLTQRYREVESPTLQVMLLQADFSRAESLINEWLANGESQESPAEAGRLLEDVAPRLDDHRQQYREEIGRLGEEVDGLPEGDERALRESELSRRETAYGRAAFFAGWASYYRGLLGGGEAATHFRRAGEVFRELLEIEGQAASSLDPEWLGLESAWRCRALIGLAQATAAQGDTAESEVLCRLLEHASVPPELQDQAPFWFVQGLLNARQYTAAKSAAEEAIAEFGNQPTQGKYSLCMSLVRLGLRADGAGDAERRSLGMLGLQGLARLGLRTEVRKWSEHYGVELDEAQDFLLRWAAAQPLLEKATVEQSPESLQAAAAALRAAIAMPDAAAQVQAAARCRMELAWCQHSLGQFGEAGANFERAVAGLKSADPTRAAQAAWSAFLAYSQLMDGQPLYRSAALEVLSTLRRDFPGDPLAQKAEVQLAKLTGEAQGPEAVIAQLEKSAPGEASYAAKRFEICRQRYQIWQSADEPERPRAAESLLAELRQCAGHQPPLLSADQRLRCHLMAAEVLLHGAGANPAAQRQAADELARADSLASLLPPTHPQAAETHYRQLQWAGLVGDEGQRKRHAGWLVQHAAGSVYEVPSLIVIAKQLDDALRGQGTAASRAVVEEAYRAYERLSAVLGTSVETLRADKNARLALSKRADYAARLDRHDEAAKCLEALLAAYPQERSYLQRAGLAQFQAGERARSLDHWRTLLAGSTGGSDSWLEAKYYQLACLQVSDRPAAERVYQQYRLLYPDERGAWHERIRALMEGKGESPPP